MINDLDSRVSVVETDLVTSIYDATAANTCSTDLVDGKLSTTIDTSIVNSVEDPGYILPVFRDLDKNGFVHIKAIPASEITALFA